MTTKSIMPETHRCFRSDSPVSARTMIGGGLRAAPRGGRMALSGAQLAGHCAEVQMNGARKLLLCVDDEEIGLRMRKLVLEAEGYDVLTANSGRDSLVLLQHNPVSAVVLDYRMPGMDGETTAREMKRLKPTVPVLMLTAYVDACRELDAIDFLVSKGDDPVEFLDAVKQMLAA
jgi:CheY-like chemotaxis protein